MREFSQLSSASKSLLRRSKTVPGASIKMAIAAAVVRSAVMQHCKNAWLIGSGVAPVDLVRIRPRRNHILHQGRGGAKFAACRNGRALLRIGERERPRQPRAVPQAVLCLCSGHGRWSLKFEDREAAILLVLGRRWWSWPDIDPRIRFLFSVSGSLLIADW